MVPKVSREAGCGIKQGLLGRLIIQRAKPAPMHQAERLAPLNLQNRLGVTSSELMNVMRRDSAWELYPTVGMSHVGKGLEVTP